MVSGTFETKGSPQSGSVDMWYKATRSGELGSAARASYAGFRLVWYVCSDVDVMPARDMYA